MPRRRGTGRAMASARERSRTGCVARGRGDRHPLRSTVRSPSSRRWASCIALLAAMPMSPAADRAKGTARCFWCGRTAGWSRNRARPAWSRPFVSSLTPRGSSFAPHTYTCEGREARVNRWRRYPERLAAVIDRLRDMRVENQEAGKLLGQFADRPATAVYIDPPYLADRTDGYRVEAQCTDYHAALLDQSVKCSCMIMVSGYDSEAYKETLGRIGKSRCVKLETATRGTNGKRYAREEVLWLNPPVEHALTTGKVRIRLTPKEKNDQKVNPPRARWSGVRYTRLQATEWPEVGNA